MNTNTFEIVLDDTATTALTKFWNGEFFNRGSLLALACDVFWTAGAERRTVPADWDGVPTDTVIEELESVG